MQLYLQPLQLPCCRRILTSVLPYIIFEYKIYFLLLDKNVLNLAAADFVDELHAAVPAATAAALLQKDTHFHFAL